MHWRENPSNTKQITEKTPIKISISKTFMVTYARHDEKNKNFEAKITTINLDTNLLQGSIFQNE
ncbi:MAG: hypothetical protein PVH12_06950 [Candidatus Bathyarchaeota archaeon]|jgi:hypothetical protein